MTPGRLTTSLWDFSRYVRTGPGEPFEDLDAVFAQAVERGHDTVRICAMPFLPFGSGAAPQHPMWADVALHRACNQLFTH